MSSRKVGKYVRSKAPERTKMVVYGDRVPPPRDDRLGIIESLMLGGQWLGGLSIAALAESWGMQVSTVAGDASEAARTLRRRVDKEAVSGELMAVLRSVIATGKSRDRILACREMRELLELSAKREKIEMSVAQMTPEEAEERLGVLQQRLDALKKSDS